MRSKLTLVANTSIAFQHNTARKGGAILIDDTTGINVCSNLLLKNARSELTSCFISTQPPVITDNSIEVMFNNNKASEQGDDIFGGMIGSCTVSSTTETGLSLLRNITVNNGTKYFNKTKVTSAPIQLCLCLNGTHDCYYDHPKFSVARGGTITVSAMAVDQVDEPVPAFVNSYFTNQKKGNSDVSRGQSVQKIKTSCTDLNFTITTELSEVELNLYASGPCSDFTRREIIIKMLPCPIGFEIASSQCKCEKRLQLYTNSCSIDNNSIRRSGDFWVGISRHSSGNYSGLVLQPHCPLDYCRGDTADIKIHNLDSQCGFNRSGILCGSCQSNLSLSLGSSQCQECSNSLLLGLLVTFVNMGIALVFLLFLLRLTVSTGTLSGLIFYANIVAVNKAIFIPSGTTNFLTIFIAWINLDYGIETCFFSEMDTYWHTWLQFVFPIYIWILVALLIMGSRYIAKFPKILGQNPVSVLSTLFLLSYAKILRTLITTFSASVLEYPDNSTQTVWLYDGSIGYLKGKHIPLYLFSLIFLLFLFLPYTLFLFVGQWLRALSNKRMRRLMNSATIKIFLDSHYAPYHVKHRYWPGLLLLLRCILFLIFALEMGGDRSTTLAAIGLTALGVASFTRTTGSIYTNGYLDILEGSFILNLGILTAATYHVELVGGNQVAVLKTSFGIVFFEFLGIILYHVYLQIKDTAVGEKVRSILVKSQLERIYLYRKQNATSGRTEININHATQPTSSYVELHELNRPLACTQD